MNAKLNKSDWILMAIIFGTTILLGCIDYYREGNKLIEYVIDFPTNTALSILIIVVFIKVIIPRFLVNNKNYVSFFVFSLLLLVSVGTLDRIIGTLTAGKSLSSISNIFNFLLGGLYNAVDMAGFPLGVVLIKKFYEGQQELASIQKKQKENELKLLRSQIDPHFLFNNLNTLDALVDKNPEKAKEYINRLSLIYRYLIQTKDAEVMELSKEIEFANNYIFLTETRFGDDYSFKIDDDNLSIDLFIPTGAIQILLENIVKHNKATPTKTIEATLKISSDWIVIENSKSNVISKTDSLGTGLANLKSRYKLLTDKEIMVKNTKSNFTVTIPVISLSS